MQFYIVFFFTTSFSLFYFLSFSVLCAVFLFFLRVSLYVLLWFLEKKNDHSIHSFFFFFFRLVRNNTGNDRTKWKHNAKINKTKADKNVSDKYLSHQIHIDFLMGFYHSHHLQAIYEMFYFFFSVVVLSFILSSQKRVHSEREILSCEKPRTKEEERKKKTHKEKNLLGIGRKEQLNYQWFRWTNKTQFTQVTEKDSFSFCLFKLSIQLFAVVIITFHLRFAHSFFFFFSHVRFTSIQFILLLSCKCMSTFIQIGFDVTVFCDYN